MKLRFDIVVAAKEFQIGDGFEADDLVPAGRVDHEVAGNGEEIGAPGGDVFPVFRGIGPRHNFRHHVLQLMRAGQDTAKTSPEGGFLRKYDCFKPFQFSANPMHVDPLLLPDAPLPKSFMTF